MAEEELFKDLLYLSVFLGGLWYVAYLCQLIKISPIVGQIMLGILLGPNGLDFVPLFLGESNETAVAEASGGEEVANYLIQLGQLGVTFLIFESGLHVDFKTLREVGGSSFVVALLGTTLSIAFGMAFAPVLGFDAYPEGLAIGAVIAPTSVGIALKLLVDANVLDSVFGQTIVTAAFTDDIFSLVTLAVLLQLASGDITAFGVIAPFLWCGLFIGAAFANSAKLLPMWLPKLLDKLEKKLGQYARDVIHFTIMFLAMAGFGFVGDLIGSHLLGAFLAGVTFSKIPRTHHLWEHNMEVINIWLLALFFGATVGFAVPVDQLLSLDIFWKGAVLGFVPTILAKILSASFLKQRWVIGWAMVGRGEFSFLVGDIYKNTDFQDTGEKFLSDDGFAVAVWGLLIAIFVAPIAFGLALASQLDKEATTNNRVASADEKFPPPRNMRSSMFAGGRLSSVAMVTSTIFKGNANRFPRSEWLITVTSRFDQKLVKNMMSLFAAEKINAMGYSTEGTLAQSLMAFTVMIPDPAAAGGANMSLAFTDNFFNFSMDKYIDRLRGKILELVNGQADVTIDPQHKRASGTNDIRAALENPKWKTMKPVKNKGTETLRGETLLETEYEGNEMEAELGEREVTESGKMVPKI